MVALNQFNVVHQRFNAVELFTLLRRTIPKTS